MEVTDVQYKESEIGVIPVDWNVKKISDFSKPVRGGSPRPAGSPLYFNGDYIPWLTVAALTNISSSQIFVSETEGFLTQLGSEYSRTLEKGTLIIANSGATLGVAKLLAIKCCANDGIAALNNFSREVDKAYVVYYINSITQKLREVVATGNGQPNLNTILIGDLRIPLPPTKSEQTAIATALSDTDALIENLEKLIAKKRNIKQGVMQELLKPKPEWKKQKLGELLDYEQPTKYLVKDSEYNDNNLIPVLTAGKTFILGYTDEDFGIYENLPVIIFDDFTTATKFVTFPFKAKSSAMKMLKAKNKEVYLRLIYEIMQTVHFPLSDHKRYWISEYQNIEVKVPSPPEQEIISQILSDMDLDIDSLGKKLKKYKLVKQGMMQALLTGKIRLV